MEYIYIKLSSSLFFGSFEADKNQFAYFKYMILVHGLSYYVDLKMKRLQLLLTKIYKTYRGLLFIIIRFFL